jgi:hypothetical protein
MFIKKKKTKIFFLVSTIQAKIKMHTYEVKKCKVYVLGRGSGGGGGVLLHSYVQGLLQKILACL